MNRSGVLIVLAFFESVYLPQRLVGRSPGTIKLYRLAIGQFANFLGRQPTLGDLNSPTVVGFLAWHSRQSRVSSAAATNSLRNRILPLWNFAARCGLVSTWPAVPKLPEPQRIPTAWTLDQLRSLLGAARGVPGEIAGIPAAAFWETLILLLYDTGLRSGAAFRLRWEWFDEQAASLYVPAEIQKDRQDLLLRVSLQTAAALAAIRQPSRELIFPWPRDPSLRFLAFRRILQAAGLPHGRRDLYQRLRRTTATLGRFYGGSQGFDPTAQLGHSSDMVTRRHYLAPTYQVQAADVLPRP
jgi:integrase